MSWQTVKNEIKDRISALSGKGDCGTGKVYDFQRTPQGVRLTSNDPQFKKLFIPNEGARANTWFVTRSKRVSENIEGETSQKITHHVLLLGFLEVSDVNKTDLTFQDTVDSVCEDIETGDTTLNGIAEGMTNPTADISYGWLENVTCHFAKVAFEVEEIE